MLEEAEEGTQAFDMNPNLVDVLGAIGLFGVFDMVQRGLDMPPTQAD